MNTNDAYMSRLAREIIEQLTDVPITALLRAVQERADVLGLVWRLRPATVGAPGPSGQTRITYDGDTELVNAVSLIGRLPTGARVMGLITPPAGNHIVGFLGADFPASQALEAIGRPYLVVAPAVTATLANTTYVDISGFSFTAAPRAQYLLKVRAAVGGPLGSDVKVRWTVPSGATMNRYIVGIPSGATGSNASADISTAIRRSATTDVAVGTFGGAGPGNDFTAHWEDSLLTMSTTGGTVQLQAALLAAAGSGSFHSGSQMEVQRYR